MAKLSRPIKKAPMARSKSSTSDGVVGGTSSSALKNEIHPDEEMKESSNSLNAYVEDQTHNDAIMSEPSTSVHHSPKKGATFKFSQLSQKKESTREAKDQKDETMHDAESAPVFTHVDLKKFICPTSIGKTKVKAEKAHISGSPTHKPSSSSSSGYYKPFNNSPDEQVRDLQRVAPFH